MSPSCKYWDCGWCYAPADVPTNDENGACNNPTSCEQYQGDTPVYSCHNIDKERLERPLLVQIGHNLMGGRRMVTHYPSWLPIPCGHTESATDPKCEGCKWRRDDSE